MRRYNQFHSLQIKIYLQHKTCCYKFGRDCSHFHWSVTFHQSLPPLIRLLLFVGSWWSCEPQRQAADRCSALLIFQLCNFSTGFSVLCKSLWILPSGMAESQAWSILHHFLYTYTSAAPHTVRGRNNIFL